MTQPVPTLTHVCDLTIEVAAPVEIGDTGLGRRRIIPIVGGSVVGARLTGRIAPGGADYQIIRPDGFTELEARYALELDDGARVYVDNRGVRDGPPEALERLRRGEPVDPALIYFRSAPRFESGDRAYRWLMRSLFLGVGARFPDRVELSVFQVG